MASDLKIPKHDDGGRVMDEGGNQLDLEEGLQALLARQGDLAASKEMEVYTTSGGDMKGRPVDAASRV